jgi:hypothetical protein
MLTVASTYTGICQDSGSAAPGAAAAATPDRPLAAYFQPQQHRDNSSAAASSSSSSSSTSVAFPITAASRAPVVQPVVLQQLQQDTQGHQHQHQQQLLLPAAEHEPAQQLMRHTHGEHQQQLTMALLRAAFANMMHASPQPQSQQAPASELTSPPNNVCSPVTATTNSSSSSSSASAAAATPGSGSPLQSNSSCRNVSIGEPQYLAGSAAEGCAQAPAPMALGTAAAAGAPAGPLSWLAGLSAFQAVLTAGWDEDIAAAAVTAVASEAAAAAAAAAAPTPTAGKFEQNAGRLYGTCTADTMHQGQTDPSAAAAAANQGAGGWAPDIAGINAQAVAAAALAAARTTLAGSTILLFEQQTPAQTSCRTVDLISTSSSDVPSISGSVRSPRSSSSSRVLSAAAAPAGDDSSAIGTETYSWTFAEPAAAAAAGSCPADSSSQAVAKLHISGHGSSANTAVLHSGLTGTASSHSAPAVVPLESATAQPPPAPEVAAAAVDSAAEPVTPVVAAVAAAADSAAAAQDNNLSAMQMNEGFRAFIAMLLPTQQEKAVKRRTLDAVCRACEQMRDESPDTGLRWQVASVTKTGSYEKATDLRGK